MYLSYIERCRQHTSETHIFTLKVSCLCFSLLTSCVPFSFYKSDDRISWQSGALNHTIHQCLMQQWQMQSFNSVNNIVYWRVRSCASKYNWISTRGTVKLGNMLWTGIFLHFTWTSSHELYFMHRPYMWTVDIYL